MAYEDDETDVAAPPMDDEEGVGPEATPAVAPPMGLDAAVLPPRPSMLPPPPGTGYTYSTNGPGNFATTQQAAVPWGGSVTLPGNVQNFAAAQSPVVPPGSSDDYWRRFAQSYRNLPLDQAQQAINAAVKYQGMRGYQRDIESGNVTAEQALAKWAPMIFADQKGGGVMGALNPKPEHVGSALYDPATKTWIQPPPTPLQPRFQPARTDAAAKSDYDHAIREIAAADKAIAKLIPEDGSDPTDPVAKKQVSDLVMARTMAQERAAKARAQMNVPGQWVNPPSAAAPATPPAVAAAIAEPQRQAVQAPKAAPKKIRVRSPEGKVGSIDADKKDAAIARGYTIL